jgi:hypothetical protein
MDHGGQAPLDDMILVNGIEFQALLGVQRHFTVFLVQAGVPPEFWEMKRGLNAL